MPACVAAILAYNGSAAAQPEGTLSFVRSGHRLV
jgi:hypothetical protein